MMSDQDDRAATVDSFDLIDNDEEMQGFRMSEISSALDEMVQGPYLTFATEVGIIILEQADCSTFSTGFLRWGYHPFHC